MLKIKAPIQLRIGLPTSVASDGFCQRMSGNYQLMNARIAPKDLLFLTTQPPELPEDLGGMNISTTTAFTDVRNMTVEVVNNVVNRILLDGHSSFTYQDQVYITTVLNKLGISDVSFFMQEVRRLRQEQNSREELTKLYRSEVTRTLRSLLPGQQPEQRRTLQEAEPSQSVLPTPRYYIHNEIYKRLDTENIYQEMGDVYHNTLQTGERIENKELRIAEQLRLSRELHLAQLKQNYFNSRHVELKHHINRFEQGMDTTEPVTEEAVLARAAEAVLLSTVDKVLTHLIRRETIVREPWVQIGSNLYQTAENTISRFESYNSEGAVFYRQGDTYLERKQSSIDQEIRLMQSLTQLYSDQTMLVHRHPAEVAEGETPDLPGAAGEGAEQKAPDRRREGDTYIDLRQSRQYETNSLLQQVTRMLAEREITVHRQSGEVPAAAEADTPMRGAEPLSRIELQRLERERTLRQQLVQNLVEQHVLEETAPATVAERLRSEAVLRTLYEKLREQTPRAEVLGDGGGTEQLTERHYETDRVTRELLYQNSPYDGGEETPPVSVADTQVAAELIERELREIDRRNRERETYFRTLQQTERMQVQTQQADTKRTMRDAMRALEQPELVLREVQQAEQQRETRRESALPEQLMQGVDPATRQILETVLQYEKNPEAALADGKIQRSNLGMLHADTAKFRDEPAVILHREKPVMEEHFTQLTAEEIRVFEQFREQPQQPRQTRRQGQWDKAPIVLRRQDNTAMEELVERLEEQRVRQQENRTIYEKGVRNTTVRTDLEDQMRSVVTHSTEDITELINRTMARQMNTITDQVYRQMERKLQTERSRRGRF